MQLKTERHPIMARVPQDDRKEDARGNHGGDVGPGTPQLSAKASRNDEGQGNGGGNQHDGVFRTRAQPKRYTSHDPPHGFRGGIGVPCSIGLGYPPGQRVIDSPEHYRGAGEKRCIGRGEDETNARERHDGEQHGEPPCAARPSQPVRQRRRGAAAGESGGDGASPHAKRGRAGNLRPRADQPRDHRRVVEVSGRQVARPFPVVRLVGHERHPRGDYQPD